MVEKFIKYDLDQLRVGQTVEVTLSTAANVFLLDSPNLQNYEDRKKYSYYGGYATHSPYKITVPRAGTWYIVIDFGEYLGPVKTSVSVL